MSACVFTIKDIARLVKPIAEKMVIGGYNDEEVGKDTIIKLN